MCTPPIGDPKQLDTPTAQAAANISVFLDSFYKFKAKKTSKINFLHKIQIHLTNK